MRLFKQAAIFAALIFVAVPALWPVAAFAQEMAAGAIIVAEPTFLQQLLTATLPAIGVLISAVLLYGAALLKQKTGIDIEAQHRDALQSALMNGVLYAMQKAGWVQGQPTDRLLSMARGYVEGSVPDALKKLGIDTATSAGKAALDRLLTPKLPVPAGTVLPNCGKIIGHAP
jgi:hypothetical protein